MKINVFLTGLLVINSVGFGMSKSDRPYSALPNAQNINFVSHENDKRIDVMIDNKLFTSYIWPDKIFKPVLYPINSAGGNAVTRGFPLNPRSGERVDHPHQVGLWLTYGDVDKLDFWNNSEAIPTDKKNGYGTIKHIRVNKQKGGQGEAILKTTESWVDPSGKELLAENTEYHFIAEGSVRIIDRITTLTATNKTVSLKDNKEGMIGMRVARQLELPSKEELVLTDSKGIPTTVAKMNNKGVTGDYRSSEGITGEAIWSTRAKWMELTGTINSEKIALVIFDHPKNQSYPTYWHARGYGLFAANPLGWNVFSNGKETLNFSIQKGQSSVFRYRILIHSGNLTDAQINSFADEFAKKY